MEPLLSMGQLLASKRLFLLAILAIPVVAGDDDPSYSHADVSHNNDKIFLHSFRLNDRNGYRMRNFN